MLCERNDLPCDEATLVAFNPIDETHSAGFLACRHSRVGVVYYDAPQPHLIAYPPLRLLSTEQGAEAFLQACVRDGDPRCLSFGADADDGELTWRLDLTSTDPRHIDEKLAEMREFFDARWHWMKRTAAARTRKGAGLFSRFFSILAEAMEREDYEPHR